MTLTAVATPGMVTRAAYTLAGPVRAGAALAGLLEPWLILVTRVWIAQAFLALQLASMFGRERDLTATLHDAWWIATFRAIASSGWGSAVGALCPVLLIAGLAVRPAAVLMLIQLVLLRQGPESLHLFWLALLLCLVLRGAGPLSLDAWFRRGTARSALPGAQALAAARDWLDRHAMPALLLALRLLAAAMLAVGSGLGPIAGPGGAMHGAMASLPAAPGLSASLPGAVLLAVALLLAGGIATRALALVLVLATPFGGTTIASEALYWVLLLGFLIVDGAGAVAVDGWLHRRLRGMLPKPAADARRVVIVGAGFAGCAVARGLAGHPCHVTLIDRQNYHLFQPLLYQVATAGLSPADIATPIRGLFRDCGNVRVLLGTVTGIDRDAREVEIGRSRIPYDTLVLATGARHAYFGHDEWNGPAPGLKTIDDAVAVRRRLLTAFEEAEAAQDPAERAAWQTFVIVGGGPTGVEIAGAIAELARFGMSGDFRSADPRSTRVVLVQSAPRLLPSFPEDLSAEAAAALRRLGVEVRLGERATEIDASGIATGSGFIPARSIVWAAGVEASPAARWLGAEADRAGRVVVGPDLRVPGFADVFAIGDTCASMGWGGKPVPGLAAAASQAGRHVARTIRAELNDGAVAPFSYRHRGSLATIGRKAAVADFGWIKIKGASAWWLWGGIHILFLVDGRNRLGVVLAWLWDYLTLRRGTRLITSD